MLRKLRKEITILDEDDLFGIAVKRLYSYCEKNNYIYNQPARYDTIITKTKKGDARVKLFNSNGILFNTVVELF